MRQRFQDDVVRKICVRARIIARRRSRRSNLVSVWRWGIATLTMLARNDGMIAQDINSMCLIGVACMKAIRRHQVQLGEIRERIAGLHLYQYGAHGAEQIMEAGRFAAVVDARQEFLEEGGIFLVSFTFDFFKFRGVHTGSFGLTQFSYRGTRSLCSLKQSSLRKLVSPLLKEFELRKRIHQATFIFIKVMNGLMSHAGLYCGLGNGAGDGGYD